MEMLRHHGERGLGRQPIGKVDGCGEARLNAHPIQIFGGVVRETKPCIQPSPTPEPHVILRVEGVLRRVDVHPIARILAEHLRLRLHRAGGELIPQCRAAKTHRVPRMGLPLEIELDPSILDSRVESLPEMLARKAQIGIHAETV